MTKKDLRSFAQLFAFLQTQDRQWSKVILLGLDLRPAEVDDALLREEFDPQTAFLGCAMSGALARKVAGAGSLVIPARPGLPFNPFRSEVYRAEDLLTGFAPADPSTYLATRDWQCYLRAMQKETRRKRVDLGIDEAVFLGLHDLAIRGALDEYLRPREGSPMAARRVVGIMGGHDRERLEKARDANGAPLDSDAPYMQVALLASRL